MPKRTACSGLIISDGGGPAHAVRRANAVIGHLQGVDVFFRKALTGSDFLRSARVDELCPVLCCAFTKDRKPNRYRWRIARGPRRILYIEVDADGRAVGRLKPDHFRNAFIWTILDAMIDLSGRKRFDCAAIVRARAKLSKPAATIVFEGTLSDNKPAPHPDDPFKFELELRIPLKGGVFGSMDELMALQALDNRLDEALACRDLGMLETREMGMRQACYFLVGTDPHKMLKAVRQDVINAPDGVTLPKTTQAFVRRLRADSKGKRVSLGPNRKPRA